MNRILYAEDEEKIATPVNKVLKIEGYDVDWAKDGVTAIKLLSKNSYAVAILDIMMPGKSGMEVLKEIRARGNAVPVIMLTAKTTIDDKIEGLNFGADDYLGKPFAIKELLARINALIRRGEHTGGLLTYENICLDLSRGEVTNGREALILSEYELMVLKRLFEQGNVPHTTENEFYTAYLTKKLSRLDATFKIKENEGVYVLQKN